MKRVVFLFIVCFNLFSSNIYSKDYIIRNNGQKIDCSITKEDSLNIYFKFYTNDNMVNTLISKSDVKEYKSQRKEKALLLAKKNKEKEAQEKALQLAKEKEAQIAKEKELQMAKEKEKNQYSPKIVQTRKDSLMQQRRIVVERTPDSYYRSAIVEGIISTTFFIGGLICYNKASQYENQASAIELISIPEYYYTSEYYKELNRQLVYQNALLANKKENLNQKAKNYKVGGNVCLVTGGLFLVKVLIDLNSANNAKNRVHISMY